MVIVSQNKKNLPVTTMAAVKYTMWCAIGNSVHVLHSHNLTNEVIKHESYIIFYINKYTNVNQRMYTCTLKIPFMMYFSMDH